MKDFKPRLFQKEAFERMLKIPRDTILQMPRPRNYFYGIDYSKERDKTVIARAKKTKSGITHIWFDEITTIHNICIWYDGTLRPAKGHNGGCRWKFDGQVWYHSGRAK